MKKIKRFLATMLTFVLVFDMCKVSEVCAFDDNDGYSGLAVSGVEWHDEGRVTLQQNSRDYWPDMFLEVSRREYISLVRYNNGNINPVGREEVVGIYREKDNYESQEDRFVEVDAEEAKIEQGYYRRAHEDDPDEYLEKEVEGVYTVLFNKVGKYFIKVGNGENNYVEFNIDLPDVALYKGNTVNEENLVCVAGDMYNYTGGEKLYLMFRDKVMTEEWQADERFIDAYVDFGPEFKKERINLVTTEFAPVEITIPDTWVGEYRDSICVVVEFEDDNPDNQEGVRREERRFNFVGEFDGLVVADANWGPDGLEARTEQMYENYDEFINSYEKCNGTGLKDVNHKCLGLRYFDEDENKYVINLLGKDDIDKLTFYDESGNEVDDSVVYFSEAVDYRWNEEKQENLPVYPNKVFEVFFKKCGNFTVRYTDGDYVSQVKFEVNMPEVSTYAKKLVDERYCVGSNPTFNDGRNTFYIMFDQWSDEWCSIQYQLMDVESDGNIDIKNVLVDTDYDNNIVTVKVKEGCDRGFGIKVSYEQMNISYENGKIRDSYSEFKDRTMWFNYVDGELTYDEEIAADITAVDAFEAKVDALADAKYTSTKEKDDILAAVEMYKALTEEQLAIVDIKAVEKLTAISEKLGELLDAEEVEKQNKAALEAEKAQLEEMLNAATVANDNLQKQKNAAEDAKAKLDAQVAQLQNENGKLVAENKKIKEEGSGNQKSKPAVKVSDIITDKASKAKYKVLSVGTDDAMGTVEFVAPLSTSITKFSVPSTITSKGITYAVVQIGKAAFKDNVKLKNVVISEGIKTIGEEAFAGCKKLKKITVNTTVLKKVGKNALSGVAKKCVIKVPGTKFKKYKKVFKKKGQGKKVKVKKI